jgi:hypothetical protein
LKNPTLSIYHRRLPHWRIDDSVYFVTWRLAKSQPLLKEEERTVVVDAIKEFVGQRYDVWAYVVMDNHATSSSRRWKHMRWRKLFIPGNHSRLTGCKEISKGLEQFGKENTSTGLLEMKLN